MHRQAPTRVIYAVAAMLASLSGSVLAQQPADVTITGFAVENQIETFHADESYRGDLSLAGVEASTLEVIDSESKLGMLEVKWNGETFWIYESDVILDVPPCQSTAPRQALIARAADSQVAATMGLGGKCR